MFGDHDDSNFGVLCLCVGDPVPVEFARIGDDQDLPVDSVFDPVTDAD